MSAVPAVPVIPVTRPARRWMIIAIFILFVSECLPYQTTQSISFRDTTSSDYTYSPGSKMTAQDAYTVGWQANSAPFFLWPILLVLFCTPVYRRPGFDRWIYWAALLMIAICIQIPPPVTSVGGMVGTAAFLIACYATYLHSQNRTILSAG